MEVAKKCKSKMLMKIWRKNAQSPKIKPIITFKLTITKDSVNFKVLTWTLKKFCWIAGILGALCLTASCQHEEMWEGVRCRRQVWLHSCKGAVMPHHLAVKKVLKQTHRYIHIHASVSPGGDANVGNMQSWNREEKRGKWYA